MIRLPIANVAREGYRALMSLDGYVTENLDTVLLNVVKLRCSQINGCAFCIDLEATALHEAQVPTRKVSAISAWRETSFFTDRERAALALAEEMTLLHGGVPDEVWNAAAEVFPERELADLVLAIVTINALNRIGVTTRMSPPHLAERDG